MKTDEGQKRKKEKKERKRGKLTSDYEQNSSSTKQTSSSWGYLLAMAVYSAGAQGQTDAIYKNLHSSKLKQKNQ